LKPDGAQAPPLNTALAAMSTSIAELETKIRDRINARRKQHELLSRTADWNRLCSALDVIGDTEIGLDAYLSHAQVVDIGVRYLHVYGALQLLQTQQDAVAEVCSALQIKPQASPKVPLVREVRSSAVAHPTYQQENKRPKSNFIVRHTLSQHGFTLFTFVSDEWPYTSRHISIPELVALQRAALATTLSEVIAVLDEAEMHHRQQHKGEKLSNCFPSALSYYFSKIFEAIHSPQSFPLGKIHVDLVRECLTEMRTILERRGEWGIHDSVDYEYELLEYPLAELNGFFTDPAASKLNDKDAYIFCAFVSEQIKTLMQIAQEIDDRYESSPADGG